MTKKRVLLDVCTRNSEKDIETRYMANDTWVQVKIFVRVMRTRALRTIPGERPVGQKSAKWLHGWLKKCGKLWFPQTTTGEIQLASHPGRSSRETNRSLHAQSQANTHPHGSAYYFWCFDLSSSREKNAFSDADYRADRPAITNVSAMLPPAAAPLLFLPKEGTTTKLHDCR